MKAWATSAATLWLVLALVACGGAQHHAGGGRAHTRKLAPVKPAAARAFEGAMRALRLGGPEADQTARDRLKATLKIEPSIWEAWYDLGVIAWRQGEDDQAIDDYGKALAIKPDSNSVRLARAEANRRAGHRAAARDDYETALKAMDDDDPNRAETAARLASLLRDAGKFSDAIQVLRDAVRVSGATAKIYTELGQIYIAEKRLDLAQLVLAKAVEIDAKDPAVYNALAILAFKQGKAQQAFDRFDQAVSLDSSYIDARFNKASVLLDAGDYARAKVELDAIVAKRPDDYGAEVALGIAYRGLKKFGKAKKVWSRVVKQAPRRSSVRADALWNLAILKLDFTEDMKGGKADLERYLQVAPSGHAKRHDAETRCKEVKCR